MEIVLVHSISRLPEKMVPFYDGHLIAYNGVLTIPFNGEQSSRWAKSAYMSGYTGLPDGRVLRTYQEFQEYYDSIARSAESARYEDNTQGLNTWRQPEVEYRIRSSKSTSRKPVPATGLGSGDSGGSDEGATD